MRFKLIQRDVFLAATVGASKDSTFDNVSVNDVELSWLSQITLTTVASLVLTTSLAAVRAGQSLALTALAGLVGVHGANNASHSCELGIIA